MAQHTFLPYLKRNFSDPLLSFVFPALCVACGNPLEKNETYICKTCHTQLTLLDARYIKALKEEIKTRYFDDLFIVYEFDSIFQALIHLLKYQRFRGISELFADALRTKVQNQYDGISAVPLNAIRMRERGYNQSALIAEYFAGKSGVPFKPALIERIKNTPSQTKLNREQRIKNMQDAFICHQDLSGQRILLIDDVITTGSTLNACALVLKTAGAKQVDIGALATPVGIFQKNLESSSAGSLEISDKSA